MPTSATNEEVTRVIDGDTFETTHGRVRLKNVDAPESHEKGGPAAKKRLESLIGKKVVSIKTVAHDVYGRRVAQVNLGDRSVNDAVKKKKKK